MIVILKDLLQARILKLANINFYLSFKLIHINLIFEWIYKKTIFKSEWNQGLLYTFTLWTGYHGQVFKFEIYLIVFIFLLKDHAAPNCLASVRDEKKRIGVKFSWFLKHFYSFFYIVWTVWLFKIKWIIILKLGIIGIICTHLINNLNNFMGKHRRVSLPCPYFMKLRYFILFNLL